LLRCSFLLLTLFSSGHIVAFQFISLILVTVVAWFALKVLFRDSPKLRVMGLYGCTHKTVAMGVPLINAIYADNPAVGLYTLPLLIWHPMQLVIGTFLSPRLERFAQSEMERLGISEPGETQEDKETEEETADKAEETADKEEEEKEVAATPIESDDIVARTEEGQIWTGKMVQNA
jgi:hypothetical protein